MVYFELLKNSTVCIYFNANTSWTTPLRKVIDIDLLLAPDDTSTVIYGIYNFHFHRKNRFTSTHSVLILAYIRLTYLLIYSFFFPALKSGATQLLRKRRVHLQKMSKQTKPHQYTPTPKIVDDSLLLYKFTHSYDLK